MSGKVLIVDDKQIMRDSVATTLQRAGITVITASNGKAALQLIARHRPAAVITDFKMPEMNGLELLQNIRNVDEQLPVVLMTAYGTIDAAVDAMKYGAFDFIQKPFEGDVLVATIKRAAEHHRLVNENEALRSTVHRVDSPTMLVGRSQPMRDLAQQIQQIAHSHGTVLIHGESGVGKEVVARTIHAHSPRRESTMLCVNCAALSSNLLESELFGHERGAFTGADRLRKGRFELANNSTLLLDEISEISSELQAKLLRVLQERQFERVGSSLTMQIDVRVVATTNRDLAQSVVDGEFRQDLYYRLNVLPIRVPSLRERLDDVPLLAEHFLSLVGMREGREPKQYDASALEVLQQYNWPGNVRELQNICERASVLTRGQTITASVIEPWLVMTPISQSVFQNNFGRTPSPTPMTQVPTHPTPMIAPVPAAYPPAAYTPEIHVNAQHSSLLNAPKEIKTLEEFERQKILESLEQHAGNRQRTAKTLGIGVRTLGLKIKKWKDLKLVAQTL